MAVHDIATVNQYVVGFEINRCTIITSSGQELDFKNAVVEYNYYEDIFSNFVSGKLMISDSQSFMENMKWTGNEILELEISKPKPPKTRSDYYPLKGKYRIFDIKSRKLGNDTNENYTINFCSEVLMLSEQTKISKSYKKMRISDIVKDICKNYLNIRVDDEKDSNGKVTKAKQLEVEKTFGVRDIVIPKLKPLEAINWLCTQAISDELPGPPLKNGAQYLFWQTRDGFYFQTLLYRIKNQQNIDKFKYENPFADSNGGDSKKDKSGYWYGTKNVNYDTVNGAKSEWDPYEQIISFEVQNSYDTIESSQRGMYANRMFSLDYITRTHENADFYYPDYWKHLNSNYVPFYHDDYYNDKPTFEINTSNVRKEIDRSIESTLKIYPSTTRQSNSAYIKAHGNTTPNFVENTVPYRFAQLALIGHSRMKLIIPGDPFMPAGCIGYFHIPRTSKGLDPKTDNVLDEKFTGWYFISALRHTITQEGEFHTVLEIVKDTYHPTNQQTKLISR